MGDEAEQEQLFLTMPKDIRRWSGEVAEVSSIG